MSPETAVATQSKSQVLSPIDFCPLCGGKNASLIDTLTPAEIATAWNEVGVRLSSAAMRSFGDATNVRHLRCDGCGFQLFAPSLPGNSAFYAELQRQFPEYYPKTCPAFDRALKFARQRNLARVLDLGCGAGFFLDQARNAGLDTAGLDLNDQAVRE